MSTSEGEAWARLRLVQGESSAQVWELIASAGHTTLTVGSNPSCNWVVKERGVAPVHFSIHWDGATLRVADTYGAGDVQVDGAPLGAQWKPLSGRVRIDFGKAAIVAEASGQPETSAVREHVAEPAHPLEPASAAGSNRPNPKATLIGMSSLTPPGVPVGASDGVGSQPPRSESSRPIKATLMGIAAVPATQPPESAPRAAPSEKPGKSVPAGTLMGIGFAEARDQALAAGGAQRVGGASLADGDQRTIQGFPTQPVIQAASERPGEASGSGVSRVTAREIAEIARDTSAEILETSNTPQAVLVEPQPSARVEAEPSAPRTPSPYPPPASERPQPRFAEAAMPPMPEGAAVNSVPRKKPFPWAYVGIGVLTVVAYFAWLYLLDHI